jgi:hypothetical protein
MSLGSRLESKPDRMTFSAACQMRSTISRRFARALLSRLP